MWSRKTFKTVQDQMREPTNTPNIPPQAEELQRGPRSCPVNLSPAAGLLLSAKKQWSFWKPWGDAEAEGLTTDPRGRAEVLRCSSSPCCTPGQRVSGGNPVALKSELKSNARKLLGSWRPPQASHSHSKAHLWVCLLQRTQKPHNEHQKATSRAKRKACWTLQVLLLARMMKAQTGTGRYQPHGATHHAATIVVKLLQHKTDHTTASLCLNPGMSENAAIYFLHISSCCPWILERCLLTSLRGLWPLAQEQGLHGSANRTGGCKEMSPQPYFTSSTLNLFSRAFGHYLGGRY